MARPERKALKSAPLIRLEARLHSSQVIEQAKGHPHGADRMPG
jgi:hypothetical protein